MAERSLHIPMIGERIGQSFPEPMVNFPIGMLVLGGAIAASTSTNFVWVPNLRERLVAGHIIRQTAGQIGRNQLSPRPRPDGEMEIMKL